MRFLISGLALSFVAIAQAAPINDFTFKSPAFNGAGYSSHVLTIENQEATRRKALQDRLQAALDKEAADKKNTNLAKFLNNLESRIYAQVSQNVATAMFSNSGCTSSTPTADCKGEVDFQGSKISWQKVELVEGNFIRLTVVGPDINTTIDIPLSQFVVPGV